MSTIFTLLLVVFGIINISNFVSVSNDADRVVESIFITNVVNKKEGPEEGPVPEESMKSMRYFIYDVKDNKVSSSNLKMDITKEKAIEWGKSLVDKANKGWTKTTYRYGQLMNKDNKYVVVLHQERELRSPYRTLIISSIASVAILGIMFAIIYIVSNKFIRPIEDADNKQKRFISDAALALKTPVSVISIDNATLIDENGENEANKSIRHQVKKLLNLANDLNTLGITSKVGMEIDKINLSNVLLDVSQQYKYPFKDNKKELKLNIEENVMHEGDSGMLRKMFSELFENSLKYSDSRSEVNLKKEGDRIIIEFVNDCVGIPEGSLDRVFDKFYRLDFKDHSKYDGNGIGLSIVKEIVDNHKGRILAKGMNDNFVIKIEF